MKNKFTTDIQAAEALNMLSAEIAGLSENEKKEAFDLMMVSTSNKVRLDYAAAHIKEPIGPAIITYINAAR